MREEKREGEREEEREKVTKVLFTFDALFSGASERERERERKRGSSLTEEGSRSIFGAGVGEFSKFGGGREVTQCLAEYLFQHVVGIYTPWGQGSYTHPCKFIK